jgi:hypothetical protein
VFVAELARVPTSQSHALNSGEFSCELLEMQAKKLVLSDDIFALFSTNATIKSIMFIIFMTYSQLKSPEIVDLPSEG